jgi:hypothetical protein
VGSGWRGRYFALLERWWHDPGVPHARREF